MIVYIEVKKLLVKGGGGGSCKIFACLAYFIENFMLNQLVFTLYQNSKYFSRYGLKRGWKWAFSDPENAQNWMKLSYNFHNSDPNDLIFGMYIPAGSAYWKKMVIENFHRKKYLFSGYFPFFQFFACNFFVYFWELLLHFLEFWLEIWNIVA